MEKEKLTIKIEKAKSYFVLAQISIIIAGFLYATSGIAFDNQIEIYNELVGTVINSPDNFCISSNTPCPEYRNLSKRVILGLGEMSAHQEKVYKISLFFAIIFTITSFVLWLIGINSFNRIKHQK